MRPPSTAQLNSIRHRGYRPVVVGCFLYKNKLLFVYKKKHNLWQLPQGGIENREPIDKALWREMREELGTTFADLAKHRFIMIGQDSIQFPPLRQGTRPLKTDEGQEVHMQGKKYYFALIITKNARLHLSETEFDEARWLTLDEAKTLTKLIYHLGKRRVTQKALHLIERYLKQQEEQKHPQA